jgi:hypothetical protein
VSDAAFAAEDSAGDLPEVIGMAALARAAFDGEDLNPIWNRLIERIGLDAADAGALMDASTLLFLTGDRERGLRFQSQAMALSRAFRCPAATSGGLRFLAIVAPGDMMANTPVEFLLGADVELIRLYLEPDADLGQLPDHDVALLAIGESEAGQAALEALKPVLARWPKPLLNGAADKIASLSRDGVSALFEGSRQVIAPAARRASRAEVAAMAGSVLDGPVLIRPLASHAGAGLEKIDAPGALIAYLAGQEAEQFYLCPFVDYASADGLYRKQRIAMIAGRPFVCHMAISERWMVHYLNAGMTESVEKRAEEAAFMAAFDDDFARRHADAFAELQARIGLDYFAIDCAEAPDGRLLLFEADVAMIVHDMDPPDLFPYKKLQMAKVFSAFNAMLAAAKA